MDENNIDFSGAFNYFDIDFKWDEFREDIKKTRSGRKPSKNLIIKEGTYYDMNSSELPDGRFFTDIGSAHFESFFHLGDSPYLIVFLNTARTADRGRKVAELPVLTRWSFHNYTNCSCLCFTDPMYYTFPNVKIGYHLGTKEQNYRESAAAFIKNIADKLKIPNEQIILYGSSAGGTSAIEISAFIEGSSAISINPQLNMRGFSYCSRFEEDTGISFFDYDKYNNNYDPVKTIAKNKTNTFLLIENVQSKTDFQGHLKYLCDELGVTPQYGLTKHDNLHIWVYDAVSHPGGHAHSSQENNIFFNGIINVLKAIKKGESIDNLCGFTRFINELWVEWWEQKRVIATLEENNLKTANNAPVELKPASVSSFTLKRSGSDSESVSINFSGHSCIIHATRFFSSDPDKNVDATVSFDFWNEGALSITGNAGSLVFKKEKNSKQITIVNDCTFTVSFIVLGLNLNQDYVKEGVVDHSFSVIVKVQKQVVFSLFYYHLLSIQFVLYTFFCITMKMI